MLFGKSTQFNKIMPKAKFVKMTGMSTQAKKEFDVNVERLILANILRKDTINIESGKTVNEIDVLEFRLRQKQFLDRVIREIDSSIPKHIIYCLRVGNDAQLAVSFKERVKNNFKIVKIYRSVWKNYEDLNLDIRGLNLDVVFNNFIVQLSDSKVIIDETTDIKEAVEKSVDIEKFEKEITKLQSKLKTEKQFNKQLEIKTKLKNLKLQLEQ